MDDDLPGHLVPMAPAWALWRDIALRSAGFPVSGLEVFGPGDEPARLREVAADPWFGEALTWQNRAVRVNAIDKLANAGGTTGTSKWRQREEAVASYWQRYCAKNDTIGFFGPLGWGRFVDDGPAVAVRAGASDHVRSVHFEPWAFETLGRALGVDLAVPLGPHPEIDARLWLEAVHDPAIRQRGLDALDRLEALRAAVADAPTSGLDAALGDLDRAFEELTGEASTRRSGDMYASRTLLYLDCLRDLDLDVGPAVRAELGRALPALLAGGRWYAGQVFAVARELISEAVAAAGGRGPAAPVVGPLVGRLLAGPPPLVDVVAELQRKWATLFADPDSSTLGARAEAVFTGPPGWPLSVFHSPDIQIAAPSVAAINAGDFLCVAGDYHPGGFTIGQGLFATRHPDREAFLDAIRSDAGRQPFLVPPREVQRLMARIMPAVTRPDDVHVGSTPVSRMPAGFPTIPLTECVLDGSAIVAGDGSVRVELEDLLQMAVFVGGVRNYNPFPVDYHGGRITVGRTVLRRETWNVSTGDVPTEPERVSAWARDRNMPRRMFWLSPLEDKPVYLDVESPVLARILCRQMRRAATQAPGAAIRFTEMLPDPDGCWLEDGDGHRYTSELRLIAVDLGMRAAARRG